MGIPALLLKEFWKRGQQLPPGFQQLGHGRIPPPQEATDGLEILSAAFMNRQAQARDQQGQAWPWGRFPTPAPADGHRQQLSLIHI